MLLTCQYTAPTQLGLCVLLRSGFWPLDTTGLAQQNSLLCCIWAPEKIKGAALTEGELGCEGGKQLLVGSTETGSALKTQLNWFPQLPSGLSLPSRVQLSHRNTGQGFQLPPASLFQEPFNSPLTRFDEFLDDHQVHWAINSRTASTLQFAASINWYASMYCLAQKSIMSVFSFPLTSFLVCCAFRWLLSSSAVFYFSVIAFIFPIP